MAKDAFHDMVRLALQKEGWTITDDPLFLRLGDAKIYIDLVAEKLLAATKGDEKIAVEIKTFADISPIFAFHVAVGQFVNYQVALEKLYPLRILFLAIPEVIYDTFFQSELAQSVIKKQQINLIIYDPEQGVIVKWLT
ncbi:MAG: fatty-acid oxidation protein subunit alpha [Moorea sp. SIO2B7]|nr:fatty-acid oxidation protein subunit alpha [Moorena sp. SIO2B7]